jgi:hypothetical protein
MRFDLGLSSEASHKLHQNRLLQLAREAGQTAVYQLKEYEQARRHGTLVALMIETAATLTDEIIDLHDRLIGSFFTKSKNKYERSFAEQGKAINDKVRLYAKVGAALVAAREQGRDPFAAIEAIVPWDSFSLLLTAILADATNLGIGKMAESCPGTSPAKLSWLAAWHIRDETYSKALAEIVNHHHRVPFAAHWGEGTTSSSDGQRYRAGSHGEAAGRVDAKYGNEPSVTFYTHVSDQYAPFHTKVINTTVRDATHVLDGLLYHECDLRIEEHYTDTAGFTDHVFSLCHLLGFRFAPRIRDLADKRLYVPGKPAQWPALSPMIGGSINTKLIEQQLDEVLRLTHPAGHSDRFSDPSQAGLLSPPEQSCPRVTRDRQSGADALHVGLARRSSTQAARHRRAQ